MAKIKLPPSLHHGKVIRVLSVNCLDVNVQLGFGVSIVRSFVLEGIEAKDIPPRLRSAANHCLIVLLGGKDVVVHTDDDEKRDGFLIGRVYLNEKVYGEPPGLITPHSLDVPMLEVSAFYKSLAAREYNVMDVKAILNGSPVK